MAELEFNEIVPDSEEDLSERLSAHLGAIDELATLPGVESVRVESWWAIAVDPESVDPESNEPGSVVGVRRRDVHNRR